MLSNIKKQRQEGFTIIEVMIVLVIAAVILLIVFLAVPALQRNSRNTQRKNDVSALLAGANEYGSNNAGVVPLGLYNTAGNTRFVGVASGATAATTGTDVKVGFYDATSKVLLKSGAQTSPLPANDAVWVVTGAKCGANGTAVAGAARQVVVLFALESGGTDTPSCQE